MCVVQAQFFLNRTYIKFCILCHTHKKKPHIHRIVYLVAFWSKNVVLVF